MQHTRIKFATLLICSAFVFSACGGNSVSRYYHPKSSGGYKHANLPQGHGGHKKTGKPYRIAGRMYYPLQSATGYNETGTGSWYGRDFHGKLTANGERYDMHALSAAHKTLPLPTLVRVTNLENGRSVVVRVNDRGPFVKSRLIDLSYAAANALGYTKQGTARVRVQVLGSGSTANIASKRPASRPSIRKTTPVAAANKVMRKSPAIPGMYVQLGAFSSNTNASRLQAKLTSDYPSTSIQPFMRDMRQMYRVRIGPYSDVRNIERTVLLLQQQGHGNAIVVIE
ncbi:MAG: septal ring lytic transglycosylase RlpA family protein [Mariprofundaceae bacterium]|nr:septal ring lytic transglycosylase RlpA family protein [Mariprofundaceae bacterium]